MAGLQAWMLLFVAIFAFVQPAYAFGAGNIPSFAYLEGKAFRHGDIEDTLAALLKVAGGGMLGIGGKKFGGLDIKRVYFGNWLRDFSQAMDVASLTKVSSQTIINLCMVLGFLAHGYATGEFEVTEERLGVYLPVEHIDNPRGYNSNKDARQVHPKLRPPVQNIELEIDPRTGMKNYIANELGRWDTSAGFIRRVLEKCIDLGRRARSSGNKDELYETYRLLGTGLHTLEDLAAHSNFCELSLLKMGHRQVFCHVGDSVVVRSPRGPCPPLVTGTFGGNDFIHSLLGEASDHLSQASVTDLQEKIKSAQDSGTSRGEDSLRHLLFQLPGVNGDSTTRDMDQMSKDAASSDPSAMSPQDLHATVWKILTFRDNICKSVERTIEKIPGLSAVVSKITDSVNKWVFLTIEPYVKPIMMTATQGISQGSEAVISGEDQYEVFNNPRASDPTHSMLSKDHFDDILNEPAGNLSIIVIRHAVQNVVKAWSDTSIHPRQVCDVILEAIHHPFFASPHSAVQKDMEQYMGEWFNQSDKQYVLTHLTKDAVKRGDNKRKGTAEKPSDQSQYHSVLPPPQQLTHNVQQQFAQGGVGQPHGSGGGGGGGYPYHPSYHPSRGGGEPVADVPVGTFNEPSGPPPPVPHHDQGAQGHSAAYNHQQQHFDQGGGGYYPPPESRPPPHMGGYDQPGGYPGAEPGFGSVGGGGGPGFPEPHRHGGDPYVALDFPQPQPHGFPEPQLPGQGRHPQSSNYPPPPGYPTQPPPANIYGGGGW